MKHDYQSILDDLYAIDPSLREQEAELKPLIHLLLENDPGRAADEAFVQDLRRRLHERAAELSSSSFSLFTMNKLLYAFGGAAIAAVIAVPAVYYGLNSAQPAASPSGTPLFAYQVTDASSDRAFGPLTGLNQPQRDQSGGGGPGMGGGGGAANPVSEAYGTSDMGMGGDAKMIAPGEMTRYQYTYSGSLPALPEGSVSVLKRERSLSRPDFDAIAGNFNLGMLNLGSFPNATVDSLTLTQNVDHGYMIGLMLKEGQISISQDWTRWPHPEQNCKDEACYRRYRTTISQIPDEATLIRIAGDFMRDHGVDLSSYGEPEVDMGWKRDYDANTDKANAWIPDSIPVVYPLLTDGRPVYDQSGNKNGIRVSVHAREKKVSDVWGIQNLRFTRSNYEAVADRAAIDAYLKTQDSFPIDAMPRDIKVKEVQVTLGEPTLGFSSYFRYDKPAPEELIVPALIFPIEKTSDGSNFWRQAVAVPLAKELLDQQQPVAIPFEGAVQ